MLHHFNLNKNPEKKRVINRITGPGRQGKAVLFFLVLCLLSGCGNTKEHSGKTSDFAPSATERFADTGNSGTEDTPRPTATPKPIVEKSRVKAGKEVYSDNIRTITTLGLKEYKNLKSKGYTDQPADGHIYLVLFLEVSNHEDKELYMNPGYLSARIDGKSVENTFLYKDPEDYQTIFTHIPANDYKQGFIAWEVPKNWKKMVVTFKEFELLGGKRLKLTATPKNLKDPKPPIVRAVE